MAVGVSNRGSLTGLLIGVGVGIPGLVLRVSGAHLDPALTAVVYGLGILGGAFLLSWAAEVAQLDVSASLAIAVLALIAILPEYSIEAVLAWKAGASYDPALGQITSRMELVAANVTGSNRLLIGLGWPVVILIFWAKRRFALDLRGRISLEITMLIAATIAVFLIFFMRQIHVVVAAALVLVYFYYLWTSSRKEVEEPELMGAAAFIGSLSVRRRRTAVALLFLYSIAVILAAAEPFVESLVKAGELLGIDQFVLIQWIAPLASESPEIVIAALFSLRANPRAGITTLIAAEVTQLTLLIGSIVFIFSASAGQLLSFQLDSRQAVEFLLTASVSVFAITLVASRLMSWRGGFALLGLFIIHLFFMEISQRLVFVYMYLGLALALGVFNLRRIASRPGREA